jgi:hypothetical protein
MRCAHAHGRVIVDAVTWGWGDVEAVDSRTPGLLMLENVPAL